MAKTQAMNKTFLVNSAFMADINIFIIWHSAKFIYTVLWVNVQLLISQLLRSRIQRIVFALVRPRGICLNFSAINLELPFKVCKKIYWGIFFCTCAFFSIALRLDDLIKAQGLHLLVIVVYNACAMCCTRVSMLEVYEKYFEYS